MYTRCLQRLGVALFLFAASIPALAQQFGTIPDHSVVGRIGTGSGSGPAQAVPWNSIFTQIGNLTLGVPGALAGSVTLANMTSGTVKLQTVSGALGTAVASLPAGTYNVVGDSLTQTLTGKTYDTAGAGNVLKINGTQVSAVTGTGSTVVLSSSPTITTPTIAQINNSTAVTFQNGGSALAISTGGICAEQAYANCTNVPSYGIYTKGSIAMAGSSSGIGTLAAPAAASTYTWTLPAATDTLVGKATTDVFTNKSISGSTNTLSSIANGSLSNMADGTIKSNISGGSGAPADNTITAVLDKLFGTTQGIVVYRGASTWSALAPGGSGQLLASGGPAANPSWVTASGTGTVTSVTCGTGLSGGTITASGSCALGSGVTLLETLTASAVSAVQTSASWSGYHSIMLVVENMTTSTTAYLQAQVVVGSIQTANYIGGSMYAGTGGISAWGTGQVPTATFYLCPVQTLNTADGLSGTFWLYNVASTTQHKNFQGQAAAQVSGGAIWTQTFGAWTGGAGAVTGMYFSVSAGTMTGTIKVYGVF